MFMFFNDLEKVPNLGTFLGNNCYKIRLSIKSKSKGKSGGARVITHLIAKVDAQDPGLVLYLY
ncbi:MAG: hypothetical protein SFU25_00605 [Candidatus Caenarcaniphilales bacterium]|nr:hypothetical protein [Candidatus Caenarcaniphilales bacterium]